MKAIHAIYENGVFRPIEPVDLPEGSKVAVEPLNGSTGSLATKPSEEDNLDELYEILSRSYATGASDLAARHDEHQP